MTWALGAPVASPVGVTRQPDPVSVPATALTLPAEGAAAISVSGADEFLGGGASGIWATSGTDEPRSMGSISKLITALVVLDARPLADAADPGPTLTFDEADNDLYDKYYVMGATIAAMPTGSSMSQHDALAAMLIPSASN
ncbi:MAG: pbpG 2, partial [Microbacterium sp.]|nr:pbpG 2 [Microbacterium sp.]